VTPTQRDFGVNMSFESIKTVNTSH
jgi:hypothetical protein